MDKLHSAFSRCLSDASASLLCSQVEEKIKQTHRKYLLQEQLKIIKKVLQTTGPVSSACLSADTTTAFSNYALALHVTTLQDI